MAADVTVEYLSGKLGNGSNGANPFREYMIAAEKGIDVLEDMIDTFWENPLAFAVMVHNLYREPMIDVFSGRIYEGDLHKNRDRSDGGIPQAAQARAGLRRPDALLDPDRLALSPRTGRAVELTP